MRPTRPVSWLTPARKAFDGFPEGARETIFDALSVAAEGGKAGLAQPMKGLGSGVLEIALPYREMLFEWCTRCRLAMTCGWCMRFKRNRPMASRRLSAR